MHLFVLVFLFTAKIVVASDLQCISNCTISDIKFDEKFSLPDDRCPQRASETECTVRVNFNYHDQTYSVELGKQRSTADFIYISSKPHLSYTINHYCSDQTDCVLKDLQNKIDGMVSKSYNADGVYEELSLLVQDSSREGPLKCYNMKDEEVECSDKEICGLSYDQQAKTIRAKGCDVGNEARVFIYDSKDYSALHIDCNRDLCNDEKTLTSVKDLLIKNGLTDADGRRIVPKPKQSNGIQQFISLPLIGFAILLTAVSFS